VLNQVAPESNDKAHHRGSVRFVTLDFYRFIAACGVVFLHFFSLHTPDSLLISSTEDFALFVDFFFILSGFVIAHAYSDTLTNTRDVLIYLRRRLARIYPLYFVTLMFFVAAALSGMSHYAVKGSAPSLASQLAMVTSWSLTPSLPLNFPAWSISVEWAMYLLFPFLIFISRRAGSWILLAIIALGFLANESYLASGFAPAHVWLLNLNPIRALPSFTIGILMATHIEHFKSRYGVWIGFGVFLGTVAMMIDHQNVYAVLCAFSLAIFLTAGGELIHQPRLFNNSICKALGDASYSVYMLHIIIMMVAFDFLWKRYTGTNQFPVLGFVLAVFPFIVGWSLLTFRMFEKPMRDLISGRRQLSTGKLSQFNPVPMLKRVRARE